MYVCTSNKTKTTDTITRTRIPIPPMVMHDILSSLAHDLRRMKLDSVRLFNVSNPEYDMVTLCESKQPVKEIPVLQSSCGSLLGGPVVLSVPRVPPCVVVLFVVLVDEGTDGSSVFGQYGYINCGGALINESRKDTEIKKGRTCIHGFNFAVSVMTTFRGDFTFADFEF